MSEARRRSSGTSRASGLTAVLFVLLLALAPLHLGGNRLESFSLMALGSAILMVLTTLGGAGERPFREALQSRLVVAGIATYALALAWALLQASSWMPDALHHPIWNLTAQALGRPVVGAISLTPEGTLQGVMRLATYLAVFLCALALGRDRGLAFRLLRALVAIGALYAVIALIRYAMDTDRLLWFADSTQSGVTTGTFVNRNSFAAYTVMTLIIGGTLLLRRVGGDSLEEQTPRLMLKRLVQSLGLWSGFASLAAVAILLALLLTGSRAGIGCGGVAIAALLGASGIGGLIKWRSVVIFGLVASVIAIAAVSLLGDRLESRLDDLATSSIEDRDFSRLRVFAITLDAATERPMLGTGLGSFRRVFEASRGADFEVAKKFGQAHNSYLENLLELGLPGVLLLLAGPLLAVLLFSRALLTRAGSRSIPCLGLALLVYAGLYSLVDFPLQIPANGILFAAILGLCCAQSLAKRKSAEAQGKHANDRGDPV